MRRFQVPTDSQSPLMDVFAVAAYLGCSRATVLRRWAAGAIPEPIRVGLKSIRWRREDLEAWIDSLPQVKAPSYMKKESEKCKV